MWRTNPQCSIFPGGASGKEPGLGKCPGRRAWQPTLVLLPGESHGQGSLEGYSPRARKESDTTEETEDAHNLFWCYGQLCMQLGQSFADRFGSLRTSVVAQMVKRLPTTWETQVWSLGWEDPRGKEMATYSSTPAWKIPWMEEPGGLQSMGSQRVGHDWATKLSLSLWVSHETVIRLYPAVGSAGNFTGMKCPRWLLSLAHLSGLASYHLSLHVASHPREPLNMAVFFRRAIRLLKRWLTSKSIKAESCRVILGYFVPLSNPQSQSTFFVTGPISVLM